MDPSGFLSFLSVYLYLRRAKMGNLDCPSPEKVTSIFISYSSFSCLISIIRFLFQAATKSGDEEAQLEEIFSCNNNDC